MATVAVNVDMSMTHLPGTLDNDDQDDVDDIQTTSEHTNIDDVLWFQHSVSNIADRELPAALLTTPVISISLYEILYSLSIVFRTVKC